jgi:hypothetical protein
MEQELVARGLKPKLMKLDIEASTLLKTTLISKISCFNWSLHIAIDETRLNEQSDHSKTT